MRVKGVTTDTITFTGGHSIETGDLIVVYRGGVAWRVYLRYLAAVLLGFVVGRFL